MTSAVLVASSIRTSFTLAGCSAFATSSAGFALHGTTSIFSPRSSFTTMRTRDPFGPTHAPTGSTPGSFDDTAIFERCPGSRATALISTMPSSISGTSSANSAFSRPGCERDTTICGPFVPLRTSVMYALSRSPWRYGSRRHLLGLRQQRLDLAQVEQRVAALLLLDDAGDDVALAPGELLVGHLAFGVAELLEDHLLRRLRADAALELVGHLDLFFGDDLHLERRRLALGELALVLDLDLLELLEPDPQIAGLGVDVRADADEVVVALGVLLLPPRLVGGGHGLLEAGEDRLERDALLAFELAQGGDHLGIHRVLPFNSASQSTTVRADAMSA